MNADNVLNSFKKKFGNKIIESRLEKLQNQSRKKSVSYRVWVGIKPASFKEAVQHLCAIHPMPHFAVISGYDLGECIELVYHFSLNYASSQKEFSFSIKARLPKKQLIIPTVTDLVPGALISEREAQEMLGVQIAGIPDGRGLFLPKDFPKGVFPWRRDSAGPEKLVRNTHKGETR